VPPGRTLELSFREGVSRFIWLATATPQEFRQQESASSLPTEIAAFGTRGDGKTMGAFGAMVLHAKRHQELGYRLPTKWLGAADTFTSHKAKTHESLQAPMWGGCWRLEGDGHVAKFRLEGQDLVHLRLFGVEDQSGMDRLRAECHGLWFEEPAPASLLVQSSGLSESAWGLGLTSRRLPSYRQPAILTCNYPDRDHWTWQRFVDRAQPGAAYVRIPPGERATVAQRAEWAQALASRPDMLRRLLQGEPGVILLGQPVASGWDPLHHVSAEPLEPVAWAPLWIGWDAGHTPSTVLGQRVEGQLRLYAGLVTEDSGTRQHITHRVLPWLEAHAPWTVGLGPLPGEKLYHAYDPSMDTGDQSDINQSPVRVIQRLLGGVLRPGSVSWPGRRDPLLAALGGRGLRVSPGHDTDLLRRALDGRWHYPTTAAGELRSVQPAKPNPPWADLGDALCYLIGGLAPSRLQASPARGQTQYATPTRNVWDVGRPAQRQARGTLTAF
jgi:hypothetical protein